MSDSWFFSRDGSQQEGPVSKEQIEQMLSAGELAAETLVWSPVLSDWTPAERAPDLKWEWPLKPPPLPPKAAAGSVPHVVAAGAGASPPRVPPVSPPALQAARFAPTPATPALQRIEIRPKTKRNAIILVAIAGFFVLGAISILQNEASGTQEYLIALASLLFFGGGTLVALPRMLRRPVSMVLAPEGLQQVTIWGSASVPWSDVEAVGVSHFMGQKMLGVRLRTYDRYLANMSPELAGALTKSMPYMRVAARAMGMVPVGSAVGLWSRLEGHGDPASALKEFGKVGDFAGMLLWTPNNFSYDLLFGWSDVDRPTAELAKVVEQYRAAAS
jgi:hypothetical protein